jgi:hypothetical protein
VDATHDLGGSARRVAATLVDVARTRIELAGTEFAEKRLRLVRDVNALHSACRPPRWAGAALTTAWWARSRARLEPASQLTASAWALRGLTLWRAVRALWRLWLANSAPD